MDMTRSAASGHTRFLNLLACALSAVVAAACGGGGGSAVDVGNAGDSGDAVDPGGVEAAGGSPVHYTVSVVASTSTDSQPSGIAVDSSGNLYVADSEKSNVLRIPAGSGTPAVLAGSADGSASGFAEGTGTSARFLNPKNLAIDTAGNLYVADMGNNRIRKITTPGGVVSTLAGDGNPGDKEGAGASAEFNLPQGVAVDRSGNVYVADTQNNKIRMISGGTVSTLATGSGSTFSLPLTVAVDGSGNVFTTDEVGKVIWKISNGVVTAFAGNPAINCTVNATGTAASFCELDALASDSSGTLFASDYFTGQVRQITPSAVVTTLSSIVLSSLPFAITVDGSGDILFAGQNPGAVLKATP
jgi:sugar lactone lactonase YvrE